MKATNHHHLWGSPLGGYYIQVVISGENPGSKYLLCAISKRPWIICIKYFLKTKQEKQKLEWLKKLRSPFPILNNISFHLLSLLLPGEAGPLRRNACGCASEVQHGSVCWKLVSKCLLFCMRLYSCFMLYRICSRKKILSRSKKFKKRLGFQ